MPEAAVPKKFKYFFTRGGVRGGEDHGRLGSNLGWRISLQGLKMMKNRSVFEVFRCLGLSRSALRLSWLYCIVSEAILGAFWSSGLPVVALQIASAASGQPLVSL